MKKIKGSTKVKDTVQVRTVTYFKFFKVRYQERLKTETLGNDLLISTDRPINEIYVNGEVWKGKNET